MVTGAADKLKDQNRNLRLIRISFMAVAALAAALAQTPPAAPPKPPSGQLDGSQTLFTVAAAINAAGYDADLASAANHPLRKALRDYLAQKPLKSVTPLQEFFRTHRQADPSAEFSQYVSFALLLKGAPDFSFKQLAESLPPDVNDLRGLAPLLADFYKEAELDKLWLRVQAAYEQVIEQYHQPVTRAIMEANAYLRTPTSGYTDREFQIYVELLGAPNQFHTRIYGSETYVVVTPTTELPVEDIRRAYLTYLLDPIVLRQTENLRKKSVLAEFAVKAPALDAFYRNDFTLLATRSLVRAVESRLVKGAPDAKQAAAQQAIQEGFVLTGAFAEQLPAYEKQERAMRFFFTEMVAGIDVKKEQNRLAAIEFLKEKPVRTVRVTAPKPEPAAPATPAARLLADAEQKYADKDWAAAKQSFARTLQLTEDKVVHGRAYYGLARIAALEKDPELAEKLFQKTVEATADPALKSWAHLYLGRLAGSRGDRTEAETQWKAALAVAGVPEQVRQLAEDDLKKLKDKE